MPQDFAEQMRSVPMTSNLGESLDRAQSFARAQQHRAVLLEHLLLALTEDPEASSVLRTCNVDVDRLGTDASVYLGRLMEDMRADEGEEPSADPELIKVLQAAGQAAQQSKRKQIDGAIVLAAIVGDGKSPAAGLLESHGLTFDDAIRALQKAKAQARSRQFDSGRPAQTSPVELDLPHSPVEKPSLAPSAEAAGAQSVGMGQSADEILAAARVRIQKRAATDAKKPAAVPPTANPPTQEQTEPKFAAPAPAALPASTNAPPSSPPPGSALPLSSLTSRMAAAVPSGGVEAASAEPGPQLAPPFPPGSPGPLANAIAPPRPNWPPTPVAPSAHGPPQQPPQQGPPQPSLPPPPYAGVAPPQQSARPPGPVASVRPGLPGPPAQSARAPWPDPAEPKMPPRPVLPNGAGPPSRRLPADAGAQAPRRAGKRQGAGQSGSGPLSEAIPRRMRAGVPATAHVRIAREKIDGLILLLLEQRGIAHRPESFMVRSLSVRLRAPDGGFFIEPETPETQWVAPSGQQQDEIASWQWTVTPQWRGKGRLQLLVTARTVGRDGVVTEMGPPERAIDVVVKGRPLHALGRFVRFLLAVGVGALIGRFGGEVWNVASAIAKRVGGG